MPSTPSCLWHNGEYALESDLQTETALAALAACPCHQGARSAPAINSAYGNHYPCTQHSRMMYNQSSGQTDPTEGLAHPARSLRTAVMRACWRPQDMKEAVLKIYDNRSNLANTLKDTRTIVGKLEHLLGICLQLIFVFFYLAIFDVRHPASLLDLACAAGGLVCFAATVALQQHKGSTSPSGTPFSADIMA